MYHVKAPVIGVPALRGSMLRSAVNHVEFPIGGSWHQRTVADLEGVHLMHVHPL